MVIYLRMWIAMIIPFGSVCPTQYHVTQSIIMAMPRVDLGLTAMLVRQLLYSFQWEMWELRLELPIFAPFVRFWARWLSHRMFLQNMQCHKIQASQIVVLVASPSWITFRYFFLSFLVLWIQLSLLIFWNIPLPTKVYAYVYVRACKCTQPLHVFGGGGGLVVSRAKMQFD